MNALAVESSSELLHEVCDPEFAGPITEPAVVVEVIFGNDRRKRLVKQVTTALAAVNGDPNSSPIERQFTFREIARKIAKDGFGERLLRKVRHHLRAGGIVLWDGLPTPPDGDANEPGDLTFGEGMVAILAQGTTESFGYCQEDDGRHFQRLFAVPGVTNGGKTPDALHPHLDNAFLFPWAQPEVIHLYCRNNEAEAATIFFTMDAVLRGIRDGYAERVIHLLQQDAYLTAISNSFIKDEGEKDIKTRARPVLYGNHGHGRPTHFLAKSYDMSVQPGLEGEEDHQHALDAYQAVLNSRHELAYSITARPGQAVSFHQQRLLHGRGPIKAEKYREMVRSYGRFNLFKLLCHLRRVPTNLVLNAMELVDR